LGPLLFLIYINDLPKTVNDIAKLILFADDTTILITSPNRSDFKLKVSTAFNLVKEWLNSNLLCINLNKTHFMQFTTINKPKSHLQVTHLNKQISTVPNTVFLGIHINDKIIGKIILITFSQN